MAPSVAAPRLLLTGIQAMGMEEWAGGLQQGIRMGRGEVWRDAEHHIDEGRWVGCAQVLMGVGLKAEGGQDGRGGAPVV